MDRYRRCSHHRPRGGFLYDHGVYYSYGEYNSAGKGGNTSLKGVSCYTSKDLSHWKNEGIVLPVQTVLKWGEQQDITESV